ncbi:MAG: holo-[acyl-carrier-protein] synthase [Firmicutes bacterium HGW-Firmicutes-13]|nr:MAG: holo-[acyl-carrier-protein] synthase [Firmicutes bacterium HGW-Firmicutes-13]
MVKGIGIDLIEINRVKEVFLRFPQKFVERIFTEAEQDYIFSHKNLYPYLAVRFAAKEAVMKSLGCGWGEIGFKEIEVIRNDSGKPGVRLSGRALQRAKNLKITEVLISLSHSRNYGIAQAVSQ